MEKTALPVHDATANHRPRHEIKIKILKRKEERSRNLDSAPSARVISSHVNLVPSLANILETRTHKKAWPEIPDIWRPHIFSGFLAFEIDITFPVYIELN